MARNYRQFPRRRIPPFGILKVQSIFGQENNVAALQTNTLPRTTTVGNTLIAVVTAFKTGAADPAITMSDSLGNTWFSAATVRSTAGGARVYIFYSVLRFAGSSQTVTATANATAFISLDVMEYQGLSNFPLDQSNGAVGSSTTGATGNVTTIYPQNLYIAAGTVDTAAITFTANNGFTKLDQVTTGQNLYSSTLIGGAQTTQGSFAWSGTTAWATSIATFKPASASIFSTHWIHPVNQPLRNRIRPRQQNPTSRPAPFYGIPTGGVVTPSVSSWKQPTNQPQLRRKVREISIGGGSISSTNQAPYLSYWVQPVNQPLRKRVPKRQQPGPNKPPAAPQASQAPYVPYWKQPVNQPRRVPKRQQPIYSGQEPFYSIPVAAVTPIVSSWIQPVNQFLRNRIPKRQQVNRVFNFPALGSQAPYLSYWKQPVNQPRRTTKRQQPIFSEQQPFYSIPTAPVTPSISSWGHLTNQPLRNRIGKRQQVNRVFSFPALGSQAPYVSYWKSPVNQPLRKRVPKRQMPSYNRPVLPPGSIATPSLSAWKKPVNQPLRNRVPKRQQVNRKLWPFPITVPVVVPSVASWIHPVNQFLRKRVLSRQQPDYTRNRGHFNPIVNPSPTPISIIVSSHNQITTDQSRTNLETLQSHVMIETASSNTNSVIAQSKPRSITIESKTNQETLD